MGFLKGYKNIARAANHTPGLPSKEIMAAFQIDVFNLISDAYKTIKTPGKSNGKPDETLISISLYDALTIVSSKNGSLCNVNWEHHELTDEIRSGKKKSISAKRFDLYFSNWNTPKRVEYGVEAKLLVENDFQGKLCKTLIKEYTGSAGMNKYINGTYKQQGCMIGYVIEGKVENIISKINNQVEQDFDAKQKLIRSTAPHFKHEEIYISSHDGLDYPLFHLILDFN